MKDFQFWSELQQKFVTEEELRKSFTSYNPEEDEEENIIKNDTSADFLSKSYFRTVGESEDKKMHEAFLQHCMK